MRKRSFIICHLSFSVALFFMAMAAQAQTHDWENPAVLGINKLPYHATLQLPSKQKECQEILLTSSL